MADNYLCSICHTRSSEHFCICKPLPLLCKQCWPAHEGQKGFHYLLPRTAAAHVNAENAQKARVNLFKLSNSQEILRENEVIFEKCRKEITGAYDRIESKVRAEKAETLQKLDELVKKLRLKIDESIEKTTKTAYLPDPQITSYLSDLLWRHSGEDSSEPISLMSYRVNEVELRICDYANVSFQSSFAEIVEFRYENALQADLNPPNKEKDLKSRLRGR